MHPQEIKHELYFYGDEYVKVKKKKTEKSPPKAREKVKK